MSAATSMMSRETNEDSIRIMWLIHFSVCLIALCTGMLCNGGDRKYVSADPKTAPFDCDLFFVDVYAFSLDQEGATICCNTSSARHSLDDNSWKHFFSYEGFLCTQKLSYIPLARSITRFPDCWLLPLIPIGLRLIMGCYGKLIWKNHRRFTRPHHLWTSIKRFFLQILIIQFRAWGLFVFLNVIVDIFVPVIKNMLSSETIIDIDPACWYNNFLWQKHRSSDICYGQAFDFSDHQVLYFSHWFPLLTCEALYCFLFPLWPLFHTNTRGKDPSVELSSATGITTNLPTFITTRILPLMLSVAFVYMHIILLLAVHSTAAYFHSVAETMVGYLISLIVQIPLGLFLCSRKKSWTAIRNHFGFPMKGD